MIEYPKYKKVLFCTDFSENADYAFDFAYGIAKRDEGLLYILHILPENPHQDIIVMGTHGRTGIEHVFFGSVAEKVLRHSPFPVFIIPCKKKLERS
jgi:nucleotide-binding universal stress UspA family protein